MKLLKNNEVIIDDPEAPYRLEGAPNKVRIPVPALGGRLVEVDTAPLLTTKELREVSKKLDRKLKPSKKKCFISVGFPDNPGPAIYDKVLHILKKNESVLDAASRFRHNVAIEMSKRKKRNFTDQEFYFLVFDNYVDTIPSLQSHNAKKKVVSLMVKNQYQIGKH